MGTEPTEKQDRTATPKTFCLFDGAHWGRAEPDVVLKASGSRRKEREALDYGRRMKMPLWGGASGSWKRGGAETR